jgi:hypothetical protein
MPEKGHVGQSTKVEKRHRIRTSEPHCLRSDPDDLCFVFSNFTIVRILPWAFLTFPFRDFQYQVIRIDDISRDGMREWVVWVQRQLD